MNDWAKFLLSNKDTLQQREVNNAFEELSNMSPRDLILRTRESLRDTYESLFGNTQFDEFILAVRDDIKKVRSPRLCLITNG